MAKKHTVYIPCFLSWGAAVTARVSTNKICNKFNRIKFEVFSKNLLDVLQHITLVASTFLASRGDGLSEETG